MRRDENSVVESAIFEIANSYFRVYFETLKAAMKSS